MRINDLLRKLDALVTRVRTSASDHVDDSAFVPVVGVVDDLVRLLLQGSLDDIRLAQAGVASVREHLDTGVARTSPVIELQGKDRHIYLAGAMWALNEAMSARLGLADGVTDASARPTRRARLVQALLNAMRDANAHSPRDLAESDEELRALSARPDELSRALSGLVKEGIVYVVPTSSNAEVDRRRKYFALSPAGVTLRDAATDTQRTTLPGDTGLPLATSSGAEPGENLGEEKRAVVLESPYGWQVVPGYAVQRAETREEAMAIAAQLVADPAKDISVVSGAPSGKSR